MHETVAFFSSLQASLFAYRKKRHLSAVFFHSVHVPYRLVNVFSCSGISEGCAFEYITNGPALKKKKNCAPFANLFITHLYGG